jgi:hypothetical protein
MFALCAGLALLIHGQYTYAEPPRTPDGTACRELFDSLAPEAIHEITEQLKVCGFAYVAPGLVSQAWIAQAYETVVEKWADQQFLLEHARQIPAAGRRVDMVLSSNDDKSPFNATMFAAFDQKLFRILDAGATKGGQMTMMVIINAMPVDLDEVEEKELQALPGKWRRKKLWERWLHEEQQWHDDSMPDLEERQIYMVLALQDIESGAIGVLPGCFAGTNAEDEDDCSDYAEGYVPARIKAGTVMLHQVMVMVMVMVMLVVVVVVVLLLLLLRLLLLLLRLLLLRLLRLLLPTILTL